MPQCTTCGVGSGERIGQCHACVRREHTIREAWRRIREVSTVVPSDRDAAILDGLAEMLAGTDNAPEQFGHPAEWIPDPDQGIYTSRHKPR